MTFPARKIYLDYLNASPLLPEVYEGMLPWFSGRFGNPHAIHEWGDEARLAVEEARADVAALIGAEPAEIYFTASGSEANNWAIKGSAIHARKRPLRIVSTEGDHISVRGSLKSLLPLGVAADFIPLDDTGKIGLEKATESISGEALLASIHHAQGETGTIQPIGKIGELCHSSGILFHSDGVAAAGLIPVDVKQSGVDFYSLSAQNFYGPKGAAALYIRKGRRLANLIDGGIQESGKRGGHENVPAIVGFGIAARAARADLESRGKLLNDLRNDLIQRMMRDIPGTVLTGDPENRLPHHASFLIDGIEGEALVLLLSRHGVAGATGASCLSGNLKSSVLQAMGISPAKARSSIVLTVGIETKPEEIEEAVQIIERSVHALRKLNP